MVQVRAGAAIIALLFCCAQIQAQSAPAPTPTPPAQPASTAQQPQTPGDKPTTVLKVTTRLVVMDVVATDNHGQPVTDLTAQDFTVLEDGKRQQIRVFNFRGPELKQTAAHPKMVELPPNVFTNIPTYRQETSLNIILLDLVNTDFEDQAYGRAQILKYLASIPDDKPIAVALYTLGRKLRLVQDFTSDFAALRSAVNGFRGERPLLADTLTSGKSVLDKAVQEESDTPIHKHLKEFARAHEQPAKLDRRVQWTLDGLLALSRRLAGYPGRKNLIWISTTFPLGIGLDPSAIEFTGLRDYQQAIISASQSLVDAQIAVYPVDPRGPLASPQYGGSTNSGLSDDDPASGIPEQNTMQQMAHLTGGKAYYNQNNVDAAIRDSIDDGSTYYTLAYYPDNKDWNGKFRKIEIRVDRPAVKLRHRVGYYAFNPGERSPRQMFSALGQALDLDSPISTGLRFEVGVVQPSKETQNKVVLNFALDPRVVRFEQQEDGLQHAKVDCAVQAYTDKGRLIRTDANNLTVALDPQAFSKTMQSLLFARVYVDLPPGSYRLRVGVMDEHTGLIGTTNASVTVNAAAPAAESKTEEKKQ